MIISSRPFKWALLTIFLVVSSIAGRSQSTNTDQELIKRRQRAIFVYNFTRQVEWFGTNGPTFKIGILGDDDIYHELVKMAAQRGIKGKPATVTRFNKLSEIKSLDLLYVHKRFNYDINDILKKITGKRTLLVSENYDFNASMINIIDAGDNFHYELNEELLRQEQFQIAPALRTSAISSAGRWQELYLASAKSLENEREKVEEQKAILNRQSAQLRKQKKRLDVLNGTIDRQLIEIEARNADLNTLQERYNERTQDLSNLEVKILDQLDQLEKREGEILDKNNQVKIQDSILLNQKVQLKKRQAELKSQEEKLKLQNDKIDEQQGVLNNQKLTIQFQENINLILGVLVLLILAISFLIYRGYKVKKELSDELALKNEAINKQANQLRFKNAEMEQFAYVASHDLQEPLRTIESFISVLGRKLSGKLGDREQTSMDIIKTSSVRMRELIKGLLEHSKLGKDVQFDSVDCNALLKEVKLDLGKMIEESEASVNVSNLPVIRGFQTEVRLLFQNLISNAIKFRKADVNPKVRISSVKIEEDNKPFYKFEIADNGIGIDPNHREKIFTIFQRLHRQDEYSGTGIGLAHCRKVVELHGGRIWVETSEMGGSNFCFTLSA